MGGAIGLRAPTRRRESPPPVTSAHAARLRLRLRNLSTCVAHADTGGTVVWFGTWRVNGQLGVARSIGDADHMGTRPPPRRDFVSMNAPTTLSTTLCVTKRRRCGRTARLDRTRHIGRRQLRHARLRRPLRRLQARRSRPSRTSHSRVCLRFSIASLFANRHFCWNLCCRRFIGLTVPNAIPMRFVK
jgi:hypothetical protein